MDIFEAQTLYIDIASLDTMIKIQHKFIINNAIRPMPYITPPLIAHHQMPDEYLKVHLSGNSQLLNKYFFL